MNTEVNFKRNQLILLGCFTVIVAVLVFISRESLINMEQLWRGKEEYGYAYIIPFVIAFFIWQRKNDLLASPLSFSWAGFVVLIAGLFGIFLGIVSATHSITQYGFITAIIGTVLQFIGWRAFRKILVPMLMLFLMVPLPAFLYNNLSAELQLISSKLGVWLIRLFDISVYLEGNVIDLGVYKLQVVEACSGLRYLFPLFSLSAIAAYIFKAPLWKRIILVLSSIPITILMNSLRIGFIGVLVEYWGIEQAEGFLHDFEGWIIFMACTSLLILEMWLLMGFGKSKQKLSDVFAIEFPEPLSGQNYRNLPKLSSSYLAGTAVVVFAALSVSFFDERVEIIPTRNTFDEFPLQFSGWEGKRNRMESIYLNQLKLDDYFLTDYMDNEGSAVNFYVAYYASQHSGEAAHSPRSCLPGGGWQMTEFTQESISVGNDMSDTLRVNRVLIKKGESTQLVYYWFQQRGRIITNEYMVKLYLFWDALTHNRTDGALVRLTVYVGSGQDIDEAEQRLQLFVKQVVPFLGEYIPD
jgi:exosortase D (VPLPA-CTERM-specific)